MRKILSVALFIAITLLMVACGNSDSSNSSKTAETTRESSSVSKPIAEPARESSSSSSSTTAKKSDELPDVPKDHFTRKSVLYVVEKEILEPYGDGTFHGDRNITNYEFAVGLAKILDDTYKGNIPNSSSNPFPDVPASHWAYDSVRKLAAVGVVEGFRDGTFRGDRNATRYDTALYAAHLLAAIAPNAAKSIKLSMPYSDMQKDHWAYNSVALLAGAEIDEGYGDGTYRGDRPRTRYEAAQLLAKLHMFLKKAKG